MLRFIILSQFSFAKQKSRLVILPPTPFLKVNGDAIQMEKENGVVHTLVRYRRNYSRLRTGYLRVCLARDSLH